MVPKRKVEEKDIHPLLKLIDRQNLPQHIAIIMDGNGRWAKSRGLKRIEGHKAGIEGVRSAVEASSELGIKFLTLYAFSVENWKRPQGEVRGLFELLDRYLDKEYKKLEENKIRFKAMGRLQDLPSKTKKHLSAVEEKTKEYDGLTLTLALSYGGRTEICDAVNKIIDEMDNGKVKGKITDESFRNFLYCPELPDPDLLIRTSGEYRLSNFLLWQIAYTEIIILDTLWPDFRKEHLYEAVLDYQKRERRYGGITE
jgi:undecaprenyl diphosphate synthase